MSSSAATRISNNNKSLGRALRDTARTERSGRNRMVGSNNTGGRRTDRKCSTMVASAPTAATPRTHGALTPITRDAP